MLPLEPASAVGKNACLTLHHGRIEKFLAKKHFFESDTDMVCFSTILTLQCTNTRASCWAHTASMIEQLSIKADHQSQLPTELGLALQLQCTLHVIRLLPQSVLRQLCENGERGAHFSIGIRGYVSKRPANAKYTLQAKQQLYGSFLGLLHMKIFHQRLEQEHGAAVIATAPTTPCYDAKRRRLLFSAQQLCGFH